MKQMISAVVSMGCCFAVLHCAAQGAKPSAVARRLDQIATFYLQQNQFMGRVLVAQGEHILLDKGYGSANLEWAIPGTAATKYRIGSISKQFTATLILLLQQDGKLRITDPISRYLPGAPKAWDGVSVENLLSQTSGIPDFTDDPRSDPWLFKPRTLSELLVFVHEYSLAFKPGSQFTYSNTNYLLLAMVAEAAGGAKFADLLRRRILQPLGMENTGMATDDEVLRDRASGYQWNKGVLTRDEHGFAMTFAVGAGGLYSTADDLLLWELSLFEGKLLTQASLTLMTKRGLGNYGFGLFTNMRDGHIVLSHPGRIDGFFSSLNYMPDQKLTVLVLSNVVPAPVEVMAGELLDVALGNPVVLGDEQAPSVSAATLDAIAGTYTFPLTAPDKSLNILHGKESLVVSQGEQKGLAIYQGMVNGTMRFAVPEADFEFQCRPETNGTVSSMNFHGDWDEQVIKQ